ncbi:LamG domain-containing protein [Arenibacter sp. N53]|uniref:LamG domain-containing protein n=1 Tax=Arenibacter TaxID=178469 RepID=UPI000CD3B797|nr:MULTISPECIES: LamG domain-containing protein [Arenibacter]MCM4152728.1 LamG domain-containing protein [Arenibacter sp. N53]
MKNIKNFKVVASALQFVLFILFIGCTVDRGEGWADERYLEDFEFYVYHTNPLTGVEYTDEELAELTYDPKEKESYAEGQPVDLAIVTSKLPSEIKVLSGTDLSVLEILTDFPSFGDKFKSKSFTSSLDELNLLEIGDKTSLKFEILYTDGSIGAVEFEIKKVKFFDPNAIIDTFVYLKKSTGETIPLAIDENVTSRVKDAAYGSIVEFNGADNQVEILDVPELSFRHDSDYSIGFWVNTTSTDSDPVMIGDQDWGSSSNPGLTIAFRGDNWRVATSDGVTKADTNYDGSFNDGEWHYIVTTFDRDGSMTLYQDGASVASASMTGIGNTASGNPLRVGQDGTGAYGQFFEGNIGEITIYDYALSSQQVAGVSTPLTGVQLKTQDGVVKNIAVANAGATISSENEMSTFTFDGVDQFATISDADLGFRHDNDYSISFWVNTTSSDSDPVMIGDQDWGSSSNKGLTIAFRGSNWRVATSDGTTKADTDFNGNFNDGDWHLLTVTFDRDANMTLYQDGKEVASASMAAVGNTESGNPLRLAQDGTSNYGQFFEGKIAGTVIYDYALSDIEVAALFN